MRIDPATFVPEVVSCRNSWTHVGGANSRKPAVSGRQLFQLSQRMRALLRGVMLRHLRIPEEQMKDALTLQASRWG